MWILHGSNADADEHSVRECTQIPVVPDKQALQPALPRHSQQHMAPLCCSWLSSQTSPENSFSQRQRNSPPLPHPAPPIITTKATHTHTNKTPPTQWSGRFERSPATGAQNTSFSTPSCQHAWQATSPKSAILTPVCPSRSRFSGLRSRCTTMWRWQYHTPEMICWKKRRASSSFSWKWKTPETSLVSWKIKHTTTDQGAPTALLSLLVVLRKEN